MVAPPRGTVGQNWTGWDPATTHGRPCQRVLVTEVYRALNFLRPALGSGSQLFFLCHVLVYRHTR